MANDVVLDNGIRRIRVPGSLADSIPRAVDYAMAGTEEGDVALFFVMEMFTATEIGTGGEERVADNGVVMSLDLFREFVMYMVRKIESESSE